jgi:hypothetical protein
VENIQDDLCVAIPQYDVASDGDAFAIWRRRRQAPVEVDRNHHHVSFEVPRKALADHKFSFQSGRQAIAFSEARRQVSVVFAVPAAKFVAIMTGEAIAAPIVIVVTVVVPTFVPPVSVAVAVSSIVIAFVIFVVLVFVGKSCVAGKHKKAKDEDRKTFSSIQVFLRYEIG